MADYDYLIVGAGLFGATFANLAHKKGLKVLVIDKKDCVAGAIRSERKITSMSIFMVPTSSILPIRMSGTISASSRR